MNPRQDKKRLAGMIWKGYAIAAGGPLIAAIERWALGVPIYVTFLPVVFFAALAGGTGAGVVATLLSLVAGNLVLKQPFGIFQIPTTQQALGMGFFAIVGIATSIFANRFRRKSEALRESESRLKMVYRMARIGTFEWDLQTGVTAWSRDLEAMYGLAPGTSPRTRSGWKKLLHPDDRAKAVSALVRALKTFEPQECEWRVLWPNGSIRYIMARFLALKDDRGKPRRLVGLDIDITDLKKAEENLRQSEERFRTMANAIPQLAWIARPDGYIFWFNLRCLEYTGGTQEELEGWAWGKFIDPKSLPAVLQQWRRCLESGESFDMEFPLRRADGQFRDFLTRIVPLKDNEGRVTLWFGTNTDISDQKQTEVEISGLRDRLAADLAGMNRLQALSARFIRQDEVQTLLDAILEAAIALTGADKGHIQLFDPASGEIQIKAQRGFDPTFLEYAKHVRPGVLAAGVVLQTRQRVIIEDVATSPLYRAFPRARDLVLQADMRAIVATPLLTRGNQILGTLSILFGAPYHPIDRDLRLLDLLARQAADSIERTRAEEDLRVARQDLANANTELEHKVEARTERLREAMGELEQMSYSMIHDMRAPLRSMQSFSELLASECDVSTPPASDYVHRISESAKRLDRLVTDAFNYNQLVRETPTITNVDLGNLLRGVIESYPNLQPPAADIDLDFASLKVLGNEALLTQCFGNILDNAVKFVPPGVKPHARIWAEPSTIDERPATAVFIKDNGIGIEKNVHERIFKMFERMHPENDDSGTGIGLAIVRKAVEHMNGRVSLESEPGKGTCFRVELPRPE
jgi:PAS domain S-box-containing protein